MTIPFTFPACPASSVRSVLALRLPFLHEYRLIALSQIIRLEAQENYTCCHFSDGSKLTVARTLKKLVARLPDGVLLRLHRKQAVNPGFVTETIGD